MLINFVLDAGPARDTLAGVSMNANHLPPWIGLLVAVLIVLALWDGVWKTIGMWKSARNNQLAWFVCIAIFNTIGILPILYLLAFQKDRNRP